MSFQSPKFLSGLRAPNSNRGIVTSGGHQAPIGRKGDIAHQVGMPLELLQLFSRIRLPNSDRLVVASGNNFLSIGGESH